MGNSSNKVRQLASVVAVLFLTTPGLSQDWPQWRGPNRDGVVHGVKVPGKWPKTLKEEWKVEVGEGVSSPVVVGGSVYVFTRQKDDELVLCLNVATGKENWRSEPYSAPYKWQAGEGTFSKGPRSTPTVAGGRVYTTGVSGVLSCWDAKAGQLLWRKQSKSIPPYGGPASPLVAEGLCIVNVGNIGKEQEEGVTAFEADSGDLKWRYADGSRCAFSSPNLVEVAGERQVVASTSWNVLGLSPATGKTLWAERVEGLEQHSTPVLYKDLIVFADYKDRLRAIRLEKGDKGITPKQAWKGDGPTPYMSTPVLRGDLLFGMSTRRRGCFFCLDARNGKTLWENDEQKSVAFASILNAGNVLLFLTNHGRLQVVRPSPTAYEPVAEYQVSDKPTWAQPVFLGDRVLIRDDLTLRSYRIEPDGK